MKEDKQLHDCENTAKTSRINLVCYNSSVIFTDWAIIAEVNYIIVLTKLIGEVKWGEEHKQ